VIVPKQVVFFIAEPVGEQVIVVAAHKDAPLVGFKCNQKIEHFGRLAPAVYVIAQKNQMIGGCNFGPFKDLVQRAKAAMDVTNNKCPHNVKLYRKIIKKAIQTNK